MIDHRPDKTSFYPTQYPLYFICGQRWPCRPGCGTEGERRPDLKSVSGDLVDELEVITEREEQR